MRVSGCPSLPLRNGHVENKHTLFLLSSISVDRIMIRKIPSALKSTLLTLFVQCAITP